MSSSSSQAFVAVPRAVEHSQALHQGLPNQIQIPRPERTSNQAALLKSASCCGLALALVAAAHGRRSTRQRRRTAARVALTAVPSPASMPFAASNFTSRRELKRELKGQMKKLTKLAAMDPSLVSALTPEAATEALTALLDLLGPPKPAAAFEVPEAVSSAASNVSAFLFDPRLQWDEKGNILLDPQGNPLPDNLWTQFVACQATWIERIDQGISSLGIPGSFGLSVACYTLLIRLLLYPFVKGQLETTAKIQVLAPRVNELKEKYKGNDERLQQEVGLLYMDLQVDPLGAILPLLLQLPVFWGLYRAIRRLAIVEYPHLKEGFLWIPSLYGPNFKPDPSFDWVLQWQGPLISLHPKIGWTDFALYAGLPLAILLSYRVVLKEALEDENSPKLLQAMPFLLAFITIELPQAMGIYIATNIASSVALTSYTKEQISSKIPGYDEFVKTGKWPPGVDPEKVLAQAFGVQRLSEDSTVADPETIAEAVFSGRADFIPTLLERGKKIDTFDDRGIPASAYTLALNNPDLLEKLFDLGADPLIRDKRGNSLLHYCSGYGRGAFLDVLLARGLKDLLNCTNEDGQTPLDVARTNLSISQTADDCREIITRLEAIGAEGKVTTKEDEARFEEAREKKKREEQVNAARSALKALAMAAQKNNAAKEAEAHKHDVKVEPEQEASPIAESLDRVRSLNIEELKTRLGGKLSEEQLQKLSQRLASMSPEELANYAAGLPSVKAAMAEKEIASETAAVEQKEEPRRESVIVD